MHVKNPVRLALMLFILLGALSSCSKKEEPRVLVFSKTTVFRHESIADGIQAIKKLGEKHHFAVDTTENASNFNEANLKKYKVVVFLSTTGDVLNPEQQDEFERFIQAGGGFVGIHAATDTEYEWPWYGQLVGAYFTSHPNDPNVRKATFDIVDKNNPATDSLPEHWVREDEFYNFKNISKDIHTLIMIDEKTYQGGTNGENHPMAWYHDYSGGRAFYTALGHTKETFADPLYLKHLWGGIYYALGGDKPVQLNYANSRPQENRFTKVVLADHLDEPIEIALLPDKSVLFIERHGNVKVYDKDKKEIKTIYTIPVSTKYKDKQGKESEAEDGLLGVVLDPNYKQNNYIYFYYSPAGEESKNILARYELKGHELIESTKKVVLEVATQREQCCHTGGSMAFDANGNLFLSTGDNTSPRSTAYSPSDERPGRSPWDAQKSSANTNDLRGKVLRIHPEPDGTYTIPEGNLFPKGTDKTRAEIYAMGTRNPYRIDVDKKTGFLYWGDVGPDAGKDSVGRGPAAFDEVNQARKAGYFGWPYFVGDNRAYTKYDFAANKSGEVHNPDKPMNYSPNNTGLNELPPAQKAFIWYPYDVSPEFPLVGTGGRTAMAGPVFYSEDFKNAERAFPDYYNGKLFIYEWMRGWIMAVTMDKEGNYVSMERFMPSYKFSNPMDMEFSPDGDLYLLEYGTAWFQGNEDARLVRIEFTKGNRKPQVQIAADKREGAVPFTVALSSKGTKDYDHDALTYTWKITDSQGAEVKTLAEANPSFTFEKAGIYKATLTVADPKGETGSAEMEIQAGNDPPALSFEITRGNKTFFFPNQAFDYEVKVSDKEDGSLAEGKISGEEVAVSIDYLKEGFDQVEIAQGHRAADASAEFAAGKKLMEASDCKSCHQVDKKSIGPMYKMVAEKYKDDPQAASKLAKKVINGGSGVWGDVAMAAHPQLSETDATEIVKYILSTGQKSATKSLPVKGSYTTVIPKGVSDQGALVMRAAYSDKGANGITSLTSEKTMVLRSPNVPAGKADKLEGVQKFKLPEPPIELVIGMTKNVYVAFNKIDLSGIDQIAFMVAAPEAQLHAAGGTLEVRIDGPTGAVIGESSPIKPVKGDFTKIGPQIAMAKLKPTEGFHDVYFIFKNETSPAGQALFVLLNISFLSNGKMVASK